MVLNWIKGNVSDFHGTSPVTRIVDSILSSTVSTLSVVADTLTDEEGAPIVGAYTRSKTPSGDAQRRPVLDPRFGRPADTLLHEAAHACAMVSLDTPDGNQVLPVALPIPRHRDGSSWRYCRQCGGRTQNG